MKPSTLLPLTSTPRKRACPAARALAGLLGAMLFSHAPCGQAAWEQTAQARLSTEYDSNPAMAANPAADVWRTILEPGYTLNGRFGEDELSAGAALQLVRTSDQALNPDRDSPTLSLDWLRLQSSGELGLGARYAESATRDNGVDATTQVPLASKRTSRSVTGKWKKSLTARNTLALDATQESVFYSGGNFIDYTARSANLLFSHEWDSRNTPYLKLFYTDYLPSSGDPPTRLQSATAGWHLNVTPNLAGSVETGSARLDDNQVVAQSALALQYDALRDNLNLAADRHVAPSGLGGFSTVDQANLNWRHMLDENSSAGIDLLWQRSQTIPTGQIATTQGARKTLGAWWQNELNPYWVLRTYWLHNILEIDGVGNAYSNILGCSLAYTHPDF